MPDAADLLRSRTLGVSIAAPRELVFRFLSDPENLPRWSFFTSVTKAGSGWRAQAPHGAVGLRVVAMAGFGIVDHFVLPPRGPEIHIPVRVVPNGRGSEVLFTLFRIPRMSDTDFDREIEVAQRDLSTLREVLEGR